MKCSFIALVVLGTTGPFDRSQHRLNYWLCRTKKIETSSTRLNPSLLITDATFWASGKGSWCHWQNLRIDLRRVFVEYLIYLNIRFLLHGIGTAAQHERIIFIKIGIQKPNTYICLFIKDTHYFVKSRRKEGYLNFNSNLHAVTKHTWLQERKHNILINWLLSQWMLYCQKKPQ